MSVGRDSETVDGAQCPIDSQTPDVLAQNIALGSLCNLAKLIQVVFFYIRNPNRNIFHIPHNQCFMQYNYDMKYTYQYQLLPTTDQKLELNDWLRIGRYWYNRQLGDRYDWWEYNCCCVNACPLICHLPQLREKPNYYTQKKYLPQLKEDLVIAGWSGELLDFSRVPANTLQEVCKRVDKAFARYIAGDSNGKRSGKPRFKSADRFRSLVFEGAGLELHSCSLGGNFLYLKTPKLGLVKLRMHRYLPDGAILKQAQ
jgi:putative transposase